MSKRKSKYVAISGKGFVPAVFIYNAVDDTYETYSREIGMMDPRPGDFCRNHFENMKKEGFTVTYI